LHLKEYKKGIMLRIKKLDIFIIKSFLMLFAGTFFICLFIFMMQFLWRYVDELVGKGLEMSVLAQFFFYSALTLIPMSLPLAVLLAALMTFGNFGERFELLAMKAAGISLMRILAPLIVFCSILCATSFYFQNVVSPNAQKELWRLLVSMKQTSPEMEIPEGVFYDGVPGYNLYVKHKDRETGRLEDVLIYNFSDGFENAHIIWAESGNLESTADKQHLYLHLYNGEQFENLKSQTISSSNVPYRRESFREKHTLIEFDAGFNMVDGDFLNDRSDSKNMVQISQTIDSLTVRADSVGRVMFTDALHSTFQPVTLTRSDSTRLAEPANAVVKVDSLYGAFTLAQKDKVLRNAVERTSSLQMEWGTKALGMKEMDGQIRSHVNDWHKKITLSLSCLMFFFIGAPLGAIIRKGGLGMPVVVSVLFFVIYFIIDSGATRVAKSGEMNVVLGVWMSTLVLSPVGAFFTYQSNRDSVVFNAELYVRFFRSLLGLRASRHVVPKEVIIETPDYPRVVADLQLLSQHCADYDEQNRLKRAPNYVRIFLDNGSDHAVAQIADKIERLVEELSNTTDSPMFGYLNQYPFVSPRAHKAPFSRQWLNILTGIILPVGLFFYFRVWMFRLRLDKDLQLIQHLNAEVEKRIREHVLIDNE
jgi:lipopolysaccharide export system permease protein